MRAPFIVFAVCTALAVVAPCGFCFSSTPKWADDVKSIYATEMQQLNEKKMIPPVNDSETLNEPVPPSELATELARLEQTEEKMRDDRRAIALFATLVMVAVFLLFFFTTVQLDEAIKDASKVTAATRVQVDQRL